MRLDTIYIICAAAGGTILVLRLVLMVLGLDHSDATDVTVADTVPDGDLNVEHGGGAFNLLSLQSIAGFFTMFGLVGLGLLKVNASDILSLLGGLGAGLLTAWATGMIFFSMRRLQSEGTLDLKNAVGQNGVVYLTIPAAGSGVINVTVQGAQRTLDAVSENGQAIPTGRIVHVVGISAGTLLVVREQTTESS